MSERKRRRFRLTRRRKRALGWLALLVAFVAALTAWSAGPTDNSGVSNLPPLTVSTSPSVPPADPSSTLPAQRASTTPGGSKTIPNVAQLLPNEQNVNPASLPARHVVITATSDAPILRMGYEVLYAHPDRGSATNVSAPMSITRTGRGYGLVAAFAAQASPIATYLTCTVTVDGHVHASHTVHGGFAVAVCVG